MTRECQNENFALLGRIKNGDEAAMGELVEQNLGLVKKLALRFVGRGVEYDDLIQIGVIGMIKAAKSFDFEFCTVFSTYAVPLIMGEIRRFLRDDGPIKIGRSLKQRSITVMKAREKFLFETGREARVSEISEITGYTEEEIAECAFAACGVVSLDEPIGNDSAATLESSIADEDHGIEHLTDRIALCEAVSKLPPLWRDIVRLRYFSELSQNETGKRLGITQVKVSREEQKILLTLREQLG